MFFGYWLFHIIEQQLCEQKYTVHNFRKDIPNMFNSQETSSLSLLPPLFSSIFFPFFFFLPPLFFPISLLLPPSLPFSSLFLFPSFFLLHWMIRPLMTRIHSFIHSGHFYRAPSSPLRGAPDYSTDTV